MSPDLPEACDVAVVGAGPAGLGAATALREAGVGRIVVLEREPLAGGMPRHCGHYPFGLREFRRLLRGPDYAARLVAAAEATGVAVAGLAPGPELTLATETGVRRIAARRVVLATGVREASRAARLIGGTRPGGVLSTGALQGLVYLNGQVPFRRPVILGSELVAFSAILTCRHAGIAPVAMVEPGSRPVAFRAAAALPLALRVPLHLGTEVVEVLGGRRMTGVRLRRSDTSWIEGCDGLVVTGGFVPEAALLRGSHLALDPATGGPEVDQFGRCSDPGYFAAGNLLRPVETAGWSWNEGRRVVAAVARSLASDLPDRGGAVRVGLAAPVLRYVVPQRLVPGAGDATLQIRVTRPVRGRLSLRQGGCRLWEGRLASRPERRVLVRLDRLPDADAALHLEER
jgi:thioredoxin reductase